MRYLIAAFALLVAACAPHRTLIDPIAPIAERYVKLVLEIGAHEEGYIDAYHGPREWRSTAEANPRGVEALKQEAEALLQELEAAPADRLSEIERKRRRFLSSALKAASFRLRMIEGYRAPFVEEAEGIFGVTPEVRPLESFQPTIDAVEAIVPGDGPVHDRVAAFRKQFEIPQDRLRAVMEAAIAECRRRTVQHFALPSNERFELSFQTNKPWSGYNWFEGNAYSRIEINTDVPSTIDRAVDLGCHEGYPGHHVYHSFQEKLYTERGWVEFSVNPLYAPSGFIAEGTANLGIELAFPGDEKLAFEKSVLYPLAGLDPAKADEFDRLNRALKALQSVEYKVADDFLAGRIDKANAASLLERYQLASPARAAKRVDFIATYRSYIINYSLGLDMARAKLETAGVDPAARWALMKRLLSEPTTPTDLRTP